MAGRYMRIPACLDTRCTAAQAVGLFLVDVVLLFDAAHDADLVDAFLMTLFPQTLLFT